MKKSKEIFSIVFRDEKLVGSRKLYIDSFDAAAELAAKYRHANYYVDVIDSLDQVTIRWENGAPDWQPGFVKPTSVRVPTFRFERPEDDFWELENRYWLLEHALLLAFDILTGQPNEDEFERIMILTQCRNEDVFELVHEAKNASEQMAKTHRNNKVGQVVSSWMANSGKLFVHYLVEHAAIAFRISLKNPSRVAELELELVRLGI